MEQSPSFNSRVKQLYWSNSGLPGKEGLNYRSDPASAEKVLAGKIPVTVPEAEEQGSMMSGLLNKASDPFTLPMHSG
jgi:hypothetical protein